jgi:large subunit ribosomal protein L23
MDAHKVILYPLMTEVSSRLIQKENRLVFIVNLKATKTDIKRAVEELYEVEVEKVNLLITNKGEKKAFVKLSSEYKAVDLAIKLGIL